MTPEAHIYIINVFFGFLRRINDPDDREKTDLAFNSVWDWFFAYKKISF